MIPFILQRFQPSYHALVRQLHRMGLQQQNVYAGDAFYAELDQIEKHYLQIGGDFLLLFRCEQLLGMGAWKPIKPDTVKLTSFSIRPEVQGKGLGTFLVELCLTQAKLAGYQSAQLRTSIKQQAAQRLYERIGFQLYKASADSLIDQQLQAQRLLKSNESLTLLYYQLDLTNFEEKEEVLALLQHGNLNNGITYSHP